MIRSYFRIAIRSLLTNKGFSSINIIGLAAGMAVALLIGFWIYDELSFDTYHQNYRRITQVMQHQTYNGEINTGPGVCLPLANELRTSYASDFKYVALSSWTQNTQISVGDKKFVKPGNFMEPQAPNLFSLNMRRGDRSALKMHSTILLSKSMAEDLFGKEDPMGKVVSLGIDLHLKVTGIYDDLPSNTTLRDVAFIAPLYDLTSWTAGNENNWYSGSFQLFAQLSDQADLNTVSGSIKNIILDHTGGKSAKNKPEIFLQPMSKWHLYSEFKNGRNVGGSIQYVWMFGSIGVFVLLLACINFMNLSTARSEKRAKEVGIRKTIGSVRSQLISQFFSESILIACLAFVVSIGLVLFILPFFNSVSAKHIAFPWANPVFWLSGIVFSVLTGLIAGSYPALYLSSFQPVAVLKGTFKAGKYASLPRKALVVVQFTVSIVLIIGTVVVFRQVQFAKNRPIGYNRAGIINVFMQTMNFHTHLEALRTDLIKSGAVTEIAESQSPAYEEDNYGSGFSWKGKDASTPEQFKTIGTSFGYGKVLGWHFKEGRDFSRQMATDSSGFVINEAAVKYMGLKNPVGETITWNNKPYKIIGVVNDMIMEDPYKPVNQTIFFIQKDIGGVLNIRINPQMSAAEALGVIQGIAKKYSPEEAFDYKFVDEQYAVKFANEEHIGKLASFFALLAIFISCLGLFGMASFVAEQRKKEIGVRKVLGASVLSLWSLLSQEFVMLVLLSMILASPIAWLGMHAWLQNYQYQSEISWWIFAVTGVLSLFITILTVSFQALTAAVKNPVKSLRTE